MHPSARAAGCAARQMCNVCGCEPCGAVAAADAGCCRPGCHLPAAVGVCWPAATAQHACCCSADLNDARRAAQQPAAAKWRRGAGMRPGRAVAFRRWRAAQLPSAPETHPSPCQHLCQGNGRGPQAGLSGCSACRVPACRTQQLARKPEAGPAAATWADAPHLSGLRRFCSSFFQLYPLLAPTQPATTSQGLPSLVSTRSRHHACPAAPRPRGAR